MAALMADGRVDLDILRLFTELVYSFLQAWSGS